MKKMTALFAIIMLAIFLLGSCQANKKCPAYSKANTQEAGQNG